jgi:hypothetical protein
MFFITFPEESQYKNASCVKQKDIWRKNKKKQRKNKEKINNLFQFINLINHLIIKNL